MSAFGFFAFPDSAAKESEKGFGLFACGEGVEGFTNKYANKKAITYNIAPIASSQNKRYICS
jgi:predicted ATP-grasp superfamily ATP-dependent carboligase